MMGRYQEELLMVEEEYLLQQKQPTQILATYYSPFLNHGHDDMVPHVSLTAVDLVSNAENSFIAFHL